MVWGWLGLGRVWGCSGGFECLDLLFQVIHALLLLPQDVFQLLFVPEHGVDADVGIMKDAVPELAVGFGIAGGMVVQAVDGDIPIEQDGVQGDDLLGAQVVNGFLQDFELMDRLLGRLGRMRWYACGAGLGPGRYRYDYCSGQEQDRLFHVWGRMEQK